MNKIVLISCYFGKFPNYIDLFFQSCSKNPKIDFIVFSDQRYEKHISNVNIVNMSFEQLKKLFIKKLQTDIVLDRPYKICDYRPAFGCIFQEYIKEYLFWGHCDLDMIFGDIMKFIPENVLEDCDKIYQLGHLSLYRNTETNNNRFRLEGGQSFQDVIATPTSCIFDEVMGIQTKFDLLKVPTYKSRDYADIISKKYQFNLSDSYVDKHIKNNYKYQVFYWENGRIFRAAYVNGNIKHDEFNYIHFAKRDMPVNFSNSAYAFYITNKGFFYKEVNDRVTLDTITKYNSKSFMKNLKFYFMFKKRRWQMRLEKYIVNKIATKRRKKLFNNNANY